MAVVKVQFPTDVQTATAHLRRRQPSTRRSWLHSYADSFPCLVLSVSHVYRNVRRQRRSFESDRIATLRSVALADLAADRPSAVNSLGKKLSKSAVAGCVSYVAPDCPDFLNQMDGRLCFQSTRVDCRLMSMYSNSSRKYPLTTRYFRILIRRLNTNKGIKNFFTRKINSGVFCEEKFKNCSLKCNF